MKVHKGSRIDSYIVLNNLPQWRSVVNLIKNGVSIVSIETFNGYVVGKKQIPQCTHFRYGRVLISSSLKKWY